MTERQESGVAKETAETAIIRLDRLGKTFRKFNGKKVVAVKEISLEVARGEIFGFLGPNGAGKTTSMKMLTGLITPTTGGAYIFGEKVPSPEVMRRVGFLPENPYVYPYLTAREFVTLCGRLSGLSGARLKSRVQAALERTKVADAMDRVVRTYSKGMLQRVGLAAAIVHEPELLILDEPMSGLDPVGRKEVRDLILEERRAGKTIFFATHILSDVETMCDHVCILRKGEVVVKGALRDLLSADARRSEIVLGGVSAELLERLRHRGLVVTKIGDHVSFEVEGEAETQQVLSLAVERQVQVESVIPKRETLEDLFVRKAL